MKRLLTFLALCCLVVTGAWAQMPNGSGVYQIQNISGEGGTTGRGYLVDYTGYANGPAIGNCPWTDHRNNHPLEEDGNSTCSLWYVYENTDGTYYVFSLSTLNNKKDPRFLQLGTNYSTEKVALSIITNGNAVTIKSTSENKYLSMACGTASTGGSIKTDTNINDGGVKLSFISSSKTLTTEQELLKKKGLSLIGTSPFGADKVYTIDNNGIGNRGKLAYNPDGGSNVGLADVAMSDHTGKHAKSENPEVGVNWTITQGSNGLYTLKCTKNEKYITVSNTKAVWGESATEFYCVDNSGSYSFIQKGTDKYLTAACGWGASSNEGPVQILNYEANAVEFKIAEGEEPAPVDPDVEVPETGYYYIKDKSNGGKYLYNNSITSTGTTALAQTLSGSKVADDNRYLWHVVSDGTSTSITLTNGQGTGYKASGTDETHTVDLASVNWEFEELGKITVSHDGAPSTQEYPAHLVRVLYASTSEEHYKVLKEGYITYKVGGIASNMQYAHDGGFLVDRTSSNWMSSSYGYGDMSHVTCDEDGLKFTKCLVKNLLGADGFLHIYYYTQKDEDLIEVLNEKMLNFMFNTDDLGYVRYEDIPEFPDEFDGTELTYPLIVAMMAGYDAYEYKDALGRYNKLVASVDVVKPEAGKAYKLYVKNEYVDKDGDATKYYLANDHLTTNKDEAEVYVVGSTDDEDCSLLFASNSNSACNYLPNMSDTGSAYAADKCDYMMKGMAQVTGENIEEQPAYLYGSFLVKNAEGKVLNVVTGTSASLDLRTTPCVTYGENSTETSAFYLEEVIYPYNKPTFAYGSPDAHDGGYASIWLPFPMVFPEGVEAYRATSVESDGILILTKVNENNEAVAAGGYILRTPEQTTDTDPDDVDNLPLVLPAPAAPNDVTPCEDNAFVGSTENPLVVKEEGSWSAFLEALGNPTGTPYVLARKNEVIGYYKYNDGADDRLPKGKAIWFSNYSSDANCMQFSFGDIISAIEALHGNTGDNEIFDLQGRRLDKAEKGQVNVINGKKVMFK